MLEKIKNNHLYNFIFRIIVVVILSSIIWLFLIKYYYEEQLSTEVEAEVNSHKEKLQLLLNKDIKNFETHIKNMDKDKELEYLAFYDSNKTLIAKYKKDDTLLNISKIKTSNIK